MRRRQVTKKPVIEHLRLPALDEASIEALRPHADHECLHIDGGSLTELALPGATLRECELLGVAAHTADLQATRLIESRLERFSAPALRASRVTLRDVEIVGSRMGRWTSTRRISAPRDSSAASSTGSTCGLPRSRTSSSRVARSASSI